MRARMRGPGYFRLVATRPLEAQRERVVGAFFEIMQLVADAVEEVVGPLHLAEGGGREKFLLGEIGHGSSAGFDEGHPEQALVVAQPATAVLHIRFLKIDGIRELGVARAHVLVPRLEIRLLLSLQTAPLKLRLEFRKLLLVAGQEPRFDQRCFRFVIIIGKCDAFRDRPRDRTDLEPDVGQQVKDLWMTAAVSGRQRRGRAAGHQKKQIHIAAGLRMPRP